MNQRIRIGFLTHSEGEGDPRRIYQETLELFAAADELGFDSGWLAEHHFREVMGRLPSLFPFLAAAAERTRNIRLGTAILILPYMHPLRVAEDAAVVDTLSNGRLELGIGSGSDPQEFQAFGVDMSQRQVLTTEAVTILQKALRGEPLGESGVRLQPPAPTLVDRLWQSAASVFGAQFVARQGAGLILQRAPGSFTYQNQVPVATTYLENWSGPTPPRLAISRGVYPAADKRTALAELGEELAGHIQGLVKQGQLPAGLSLEDYCQQMTIAYGHPDEIVEFLLADQVLPYATDLILQFKPAMPSLDRALRMFEQIATQIAPALGWQPHQQQPVQESISS